MTLGSARGAACVCCARRIERSEQHPGVEFLDLPLLKTYPHPPALPLQIVGGLVLFYASTIHHSVPPKLTLEFGLGCLLVCSLLPALAGFLLTKSRLRSQPSTSAAQ